MLLTVGILHRVGEVNCPLSYIMSSNKDVICVRAVFLHIFSQKTFWGEKKRERDTEQTQIPLQVEYSKEPKALRFLQLLQSSLCFTSNFTASLTLLLIIYFTCAITILEKKLSKPRSQT